jgi:hypothetical protein
MFQAGTTAQQLGLNEGQLRSIIQSGIDHKAEMDRLNNQVGGLAPVINQHMNSDAGKIMHGRLTQWNADYNLLAGDFQSLIDRVTGVLNALVSANTGATGTAAR